jgi:hypothetical protein
MPRPFGRLPSPAMSYYRYVASDAAGSYALLSFEPLESADPDRVELRLIEVTESYEEAIEAHRALEERLGGPRNSLRHLRRKGP